MTTRAANERSVLNRIVNGSLGLIALVALSIGLGALLERADVTIDDVSIDDISSAPSCDVEYRTVKTAVVAMRANDPTREPTEENAVALGYLDRPSEAYDVVVGFDGSINVVAVPGGPCD